MRLLLHRGDERMGLFDRQPAASGPTLNLGATGAPPTANNMTASPFPFAQQAAQQQPNGFMGGMMGGMGVQQQHYQQPMTPPSDTEIMIGIMNSGYPMERWLTSPGFQSFVQMISGIVELTVVEFFRNAQFKIDEDTGIMSLDQSSLPQSMQTVSSENVLSEYSNVLAGAEKTKNESAALQAQIVNLANQSMMGSALDAALTNPGMMEKMGSGIGSIGRGLIGLK